VVEIDQEDETNLQDADNNDVHEAKESRRLLDELGEYLGREYIQSLNHTWESWGTEIEISFPGSSGGNCLVSEMLRVPYSRRVRESC